MNVHVSEFLQVLVLVSVEHASQNAWLIAPCSCVESLISDPHSH